MESTERMQTLVPLSRDDEVELTGEFGRAFELISSTNDNYFITGKAGTGKSTLLRYFSDHANKRMALLAPTGIAAINVGGQTVHSFFRFPPEPITREHIHLNPLQDLYPALEVIVVDEVSMVRADLMDGIDQMLRLSRGAAGTPFGGVQMLFFGDIFQLEPVVASHEEGIFFTSEYRSPYFFDAKVFKRADFGIIDLRHVYRQSDAEFVDLLDSVRMNEAGQRELVLINSRFREEREIDHSPSHIHLTSTNALAAGINERRLTAISEPEYLYNGSIEGEFPERALPTGMVLAFKRGAQVMFVKNDMHRRWVNGTIGKIENLGEDLIEVEVVENGFRSVHSVGIETWETRKHLLDPISRTIKTQIVGEFTQYPLKLAWAITIHKSQGLTFDNVIVDLGNGAFAHGQTYVALSRSTSFDGLLLKTRIRPQDIITDPSVTRFYKDHILPDARGSAVSSRPI